ncbi:MAG: phosphomannomutase/phosphoglucomutase [Candidatus Paceibacterota bacterium]|jgi:phosphomannomutase
MDLKIFKAYDIRGIYPEELNEETAYLIGRAFVEFIKKDSGKENQQIVVGRDNRKSSDSLFSELKRGIIEQGADVVDIGLSTTPMLYFATANYGYDGGINLTASHNPPQYNGFKFVRAMADPLSEYSGLQEIKNMVASGVFAKSELTGRMIEKNVINDYILDNSVPDEFSFKIIVDTANSVSGAIVSQMLKNTKLVHIFSDLDGNFPNHVPDPSKEENIKFLQEKVIEEKADLGVAFDGDGDRVFFVDEKGNIVPSDLILAFSSQIVLKDNPGSKILYDLRSSNIIKETVESAGGIAVASRIGHSQIKETMKKEDIIFGAEYSGHYYLRHNKSYYESPYFTVFLILKEMKKTGKTLSQLIEPFRKYYHSGEINFKSENKEEIIERAKEAYKDGKNLYIDGLRVDFDDWWFLLRGSNTEPILRLVVESKTKELMEEKVEEIKKIIQA